MNGRMRKLTIADSPETFENIKTINHTIIAHIPIVKFIPNNTPKDTATPLPPLNFKNTEKMCPRMIAMEKTHKIKFSIP